MYALFDEIDIERACNGHVEHAYCTYSVETAFFPYMRTEMSGATNGIRWC